MGKRGPKPKPSALRLIEGNPGRLPINEAEPKPSGQAECFDHMSPDAKAIWQTVMASLPPGMITAADAPLFAAYCEAAATHKAATMALQEGDLLGNRLLRNDRPSPYFKMQQEAARTMATLSTRLGLSPADRSGLKLGGTAKGNKWSDLIG